jgi:hypothetical protein
LRRKAATPSTAKPSKEIVEPPSGTLYTVGPAWTVRPALTGWTRKTAVAATKKSKSLNEDFMHDKAALSIPMSLRGYMHLKDRKGCKEYQKS